MTMLRSICLTATLLSSSHLAIAAEPLELKFRLVTHPLSEPVDIPAIGGHQLVLKHYTGVAVFEDGRIAHKDFVDVSDETPDKGDFKGYSTYTFENGDSLTLSYVGDWDDQGARGTYELLSGTGAYAGATGTGSFQSADEPWDEASLFTGSIQVTLASN